MHARVHKPGMPDSDSIAHDGPAHSGHVIGSSSSSEAKKKYSALDLFIGAPVTVYVNNALTALGIAKGSRGVVVGTCPPVCRLSSHEEDVKVTVDTTARVTVLDEMPTHIFVQVPGSCISFDGLPAGVMPVKATTTVIKVHGHADRMKVAQFDVRLNCAHTCHKLQGKTEDAVVVGTTNRILNFNYTAFSRARSFLGVFIMGSVIITRKLLNAKPDNADAIDNEVGRLERLSAMTMAAALPPPAAPPFASTDGQREYVWSVCANVFRRDTRDPEGGKETDVEAVAAEIAAGPRAAEFAATGLVGAVLRDIAAGLECGCDQHHHEDAPIMVQAIADGGGVQQI